MVKRGKIDTLFIWYCNRFSLFQFCSRDVWS